MDGWIDGLKVNEWQTNSANKDALEYSAAMVQSQKGLLFKTIVNMCDHIC